MAGLAFQVDDRPVFFTPLNVAKFKVDRFVPPDSASKENGQQRAIAFAL